MNIKNLETFLVVAKTGNISEAAKTLFISQPSLSMKMKRLEEQLGVPLLSTHSKGIKLTDAGEVFFNYAEKITFMQDQLMRELSQFREGKKGHIIIGAPYEIYSYILPELIAEFIKKHPGIEIENRLVEETDTESFVKNGEIDLAFTINEEIDHYASRVFLYQKDEWVEVSTNSRVPVNQMYCTNRTHLVLNKQSINNKTIIVENIDIVKRNVLAGLGSGIVLRGVVEKEINESSLTVTRSIREVNISVITRPAEKLQYSLRRFIEFLVKK
ncbi:LysR family transcriptional regulator [Bacillus sp. 31A1R]|uniref:LysR family transcriptional regulator n=1 Tax=Robertmurraya mangrovi TaxID=3098077 RepID=A0ABU5ITD6_9BACI|nr:LysR family transcriptional regulator [Bacillus sp. 31A1R]MDZ5470422.1 LysR family transcriptional regulator [Bacillus sp. 31A1R]